MSYQIDIIPFIYTCRRKTRVLYNYASKNFIFFTFFPLCLLVVLFLSLLVCLFLPPVITPTPQLDTFCACLALVHVGVFSLYCLIGVISCHFVCRVLVVYARLIDV